MDRLKERKGKNVIYSHIMYVMYVIVLSCVGDPFQ